MYESYTGGRMKKKQLLIVSASAILILLLLVLFLSYNDKEYELRQQLLTIAKEYAKENNTEAFAESLQYNKLKVENFTEDIMNSYAKVIYWDQSSAEKLLDSSDYLVSISSKDGQNLLRLVIDAESMTVIGHIPSV